MRTSEWASGALQIPGMPPAPIGRPSNQVNRSSAIGAIPSITHFSDSNLLQQKHDFGGSNQSLGAFGNFESTLINNQYEKWSMGLDASAGMQLTESPEMDVNDRVIFKILKKDLKKAFS